MKIYILIFSFSFLNALNMKAQSTKDWRSIQNETGRIPSENYCDQPYVVVAKNNDWVCVLTTGPGTESQNGQHVVASISSDKGITWSPLINIEPSELPVSSWAIPYVTSYGRIYVFYDFNGGNINTLNGEAINHNTELGWYCFKYSDDHGKTWSKRYRLPMKKTTIDFINPFNGEVQLFWGVSKPITVGNSMYFAFTKMGVHPQDLGEGWFYKSDNINIERDPEKLNWIQLPNGDEGIFETSLGITQEEHNIVSLSNSTLYCIFRTGEGYPADCYSYDGGKSWSIPVFARDRNSRVIKNPRACPRLFKCSNGKYLLWYHNNNIKGYAGYRNPAWVVGGEEKNGRIEWGQPEILLYHPDPPTMSKGIGKKWIGMSYPDLIEENGSYWITETQKDIASIHAIDSELFNSMWRQGIDKTITTKGLIFQDEDLRSKRSFSIPRLPELGNGAFSIELLLKIKELRPGKIILENKDARGNGFSIKVTPKRTIAISLKDEGVECLWDTDPGTVKTEKQHIVFIVDGLSNIVTTVVNGILCDGGRYRPTGWERLNPKLSNINGSGELHVYPDLNFEIKSLRIYNRYLTTSESISNFRSTLTP